MNLLQLWYRNGFFGVHQGNLHLIPCVLYDTVQYWRFSKGEAMVLSLLAFVNCALEISTLVDMMEWRESMIIILHNIVWPFAIILTYWFKLLLYIFLSGWAITFLLHWEINIWCPPMHWNVMATDIWIACIILLNMDHMWTDHLLQSHIRQTLLSNSCEVTVYTMWKQGIKECASRSTNRTRSHL